MRRKCICNSRSNGPKIKSCLVCIFSQALDESETQTAHPERVPRFCIFDCHNYFLGAGFLTGALATAGLAEAVSAMA
jgi:hypothetical protein